MEPDWDNLWQRLLDSIEHGFHSVEDRTARSLQGIDKLPAILGGFAQRAGKAGLGLGADFAALVAEAAGKAGGAAKGAAGGLWGALNQPLSMPSMGGGLDLGKMLGGLKENFGALLDATTGIDVKGQTRQAHKDLKTTFDAMDKAQKAMDTAFPGPALEEATNAYKAARTAHQEASGRFEGLNDPSKRAAMRIDQLKKFAPQGSSAEAGLGIAEDVASGNIGGAVKKAVEEVKGRFKAVGRAFESERGEDIVGNLSRAMGLDMFTKPLTDAAAKLRELSDAAHNANMKFAEFSGSMATVQARQYARDVEYGMRRGEARAGRAEELEKARSRYREAWAPMEDAWANLKNEFLTNMLSNLSEILETLNQLFGWLKRPSEVEEEAAELFLQRNANEYAANHGLPPRWAPAFGPAPRHFPPRT
jgi:hypothetical protein